MPLYTYKATNQQNQVDQGTLSASSPTEASQALVKKGLNPVSIKPVAKPMKMVGSLPAVEKIAFCRYISTMLNAGLPLTEGIPVLKSETKNALMRQILDDIYLGLERGQPLSTSLVQYPRAFEPFFITLVKAGEVSGTLADSFHYLEQQIRAEYSLTQKIKSAMVYPTIVFITMTGIGFLMFFFILPQIGQVFLTMRLPLPTFTRILFTSALTAAKYRYPLIAFILITIATIVIFFKTDSGKKVLMKLLHPVPVVSSLLERIDIARFCRIFSTLVASAVPITQALEIALNSLNHPRFREISRSLIDQVTQGKSISSAIAANHAFPPLLTQMIAAGEKSGTLDTSLRDLAAFYEEEVEEAVKKATQLLEPMIMLIVGIGVGGIILSIIAPLYSVIGSLQDAAGR